MKQNSVSDNGVYGLIIAKNPFAELRFDDMPDYEYYKMPGKMKQMSMLFADRSEMNIIRLYMNAILYKIWLDELEGKDAEKVARKICDGLFSELYEALLEDIKGSDGVSLDRFIDEKPRIDLCECVFGKESDKDYLKRARRFFQDNQMRGYSDCFIKDPRHLTEAVCRYHSYYRRFEYDSDEDVNAYPGCNIKNIESRMFLYPMDELCPNREIVFVDRDGDASLLPMTTLSERKEAMQLFNEHAGVKIERAHPTLKANSLCYADVQFLIGSLKEYLSFEGLGVDSAYEELMVNIAYDKFKSFFIDWMQKNNRVAIMIQHFHFDRGGIGQPVQTIEILYQLKKGETFDAFGRDYMKNCAQVSR